MLQGGHLLAGAALAGAMQRAWEAGDASWSCGGSPVWRRPTASGAGSGRSRCRVTMGGFSLRESRKWVTWGDIAARPRMVSQQVAGNLVAGAGAGE